MSLSDSFIQSIIEKVDSPDVGVGIVGSYARGRNRNTAMWISISL
ncbi:MAG: hypothetical protein U0X92_10915 [Anaerolineales bacterium]